ncbi:hypothetical protein FB446DRAFT_411405 [Lentinula raphanica]|nr:hypothetical protein FB446DRAFT_411405 [Lentinula raphanica]
MHPCKVLKLLLPLSQVSSICSCIGTQTAILVKNLTHGVYTSDIHRQDRLLNPHLSLSRPRVAMICSCCISPAFPAQYPEPSQLQQSKVRTCTTFQTPSQVNCPWTTRLHFFSDYHTLVVRISTLTYPIVDKYDVLTRRGNSFKLSAARSRLVLLTTSHAGSLLCNDNPFNLNHIHPPLVRLDSSS